MGPNQSSVPNRPRDEQEPPSSGGGRNAEVDFRGQRSQSRDARLAHRPEARLYRKGPQQEAKLRYLGHVLSENRHGLVVDSGAERGERLYGEREAALQMLERSVRGRATLGAGPGVRHARLRGGGAARGVTPHVACNNRGRRSAIDGRTTRHAGYGQSLRRRELVEEVFGWLKTGEGRKLRYIGRQRNRAWLELTAAAYKLVRISRLEPVPL